MFSQGVVFDITERKAAEEQLREAEERYRAIVEHVQAVIYVDEAGDSMRTVYVSPQLFDLTGYTPEEWMDDPELWLKVAHVDDRETIAEALRVTRPGGRVVIFAPNRFYPFETHGVYFGKRYIFGNIPFVNYLPNPLRNHLVPHARAFVSLRIAPGDTTANAAERLREHLESHAPWGAQVTCTLADKGEPTAIDATGPAYDAARNAFAEAWDGTAPVDMGVGGSIPFIAEFLEAFPQASVLVTGVEDPDTRAHGANEGLHLAEFEKVVLAEAFLLRNLGA